MFHSQLADQADSRWGGWCEKRRGNTYVPKEARRRGQAAAKAFLDDSDMDDD
jgi:hypothetical protein